MKEKREIQRDRKVAYLVTYPGPWPKTKGLLLLSHYSHAVEKASQGVSEPAFYRVLEIGGLDCFLMKVSQRSGRRPLGFTAKF